MTLWIDDVIIRGIQFARSLPPLTLHSRKRERLRERESEKMMENKKNESKMKEEKKKIKKNEIIYFF